MQHNDAFKLDLDLLHSILPEGEVRGRSVLSVVQQGDHTLWVHALSDVELVVLEVGDNLLGELLGTLLESRDTVRVGLLELGLDSLHVTLEVGEVGLLVERSALETERVDNVVDLLGTIGHGLLHLLGGRVSSNVNITLLDEDHGTVDLVG